MLANKRGRDGDARGHPVYEIELAGYLPEYRSAWFDGMTVAYDGAGHTVLRGPVVDQAALHSLIERVRELGIPLLSLRRVNETQAEAG